MKLTRTRIREIVDHFIQHCESKEVQNFGFDESFWDTTAGCEEEMIDDDSESMKRCIIDNYLYQFGYHAIEEEYRGIYTIPSKQELIDKYFNK